MSAEKSIFIAEEEKLKRRLQTTHTERFHMLMNLIRAVRRLQSLKPAPLQNVNFAKQKNLAITGFKNRI